MKKILVVEDNEQNLYLMQYMLETSGYAVVVVTNGAEAIVSAAQEKPDLILMDATCLAHFCRGSWRD